jgi:two-component system sensor histidine kinase BaeS
MADVAHELRTPLSVLQGRIEGMLDGVYKPDAEVLQQLLDETQVLSRLVEDLRTLALSEAGVLPLQKEPTDLVALARDVARGFSTQHPSIAVPEAGELVVEVDPVRIREVISNLIANAVRYTPADGTVSVEVTAAGERVTIAVNDTGRGIAADQLPRLFDRFFKDPESRGSGLGLAIARAIALAHGGDIAATSEPGKGTSIRVTLPRR